MFEGREPWARLFNARPFISYQNTFVHTWGEKGGLLRCESGTDSAGSNRIGEHITLLRASGKPTPSEQRRRLTGLVARQGVNFIRTIIDLRTPARRKKKHMCSLADRTTQQYMIIGIQRRQSAVCRVTVCCGRFSTEGGEKVSHQRRACIITFRSG